MIATIITIVYIGTTLYAYAIIRQQRKTIFKISKSNQTLKFDNMMLLKRIDNLKKTRQTDDPFRGLNEILAKVFGRKSEPSKKPLDVQLEEAIQNENFEEARRIQNLIDKNK